jgi:hypothetical protein
VLAQLLSAIQPDIGRQYEDRNANVVLLRH